MAVRKLIAVAAAVLTLLALAGGARAEVVTPMLPKPAAAVTLSGTLEYVRSLESPHYELNGWVVSAPDQAVLYLLAGHDVTVTGTPMNGPSIFMRRQLSVQTMTAVIEGRLVAVTDHFELNGWIIRGAESEVQALEGSRVRIIGSVIWRTKGPPTMQVLGMIPMQTPAERQVEGTLIQESDGTFRIGDWALDYANSSWLQRLDGMDVAVTGREVAGADRKRLAVTEVRVTLTGTVRRETGLEGGYFELNGFVLSGVVGDLWAFSGRPCTIYGALSDEVSIYMRPVLNVLEIAPAGLPAHVVVGGKLPAFPAPLVYRNGYLMLPLRAVIESARGQVAWDPVFWAVRVTVGSRSTTIRIGSPYAGDMELAVAPYLQNGHTMAPLELFEQLGLKTHWTRSALYLDRVE